MPDLIVPGCVCGKWKEPCQNTATQEDLLCDTCRGTCPMGFPLVAASPDEWPCCRDNLVQCALVRYEDSARHESVRNPVRRPGLLVIDLRSRSLDRSGSLEGTNLRVPFPGELEGM